MIALTCVQLLDYSIDLDSLFDALFQPNALAVQQKKLT